MIRSTLFAACCLLLALYVRPANALVITVDTFADENGAGTDCALREAVEAADSDAAFGGCPAGSGADTIVLPDGTYTLTLGSQIVIDTDLIIEPATTSATIQAAVATNSVTYRVFTVSSGSSVTLNDLVVRNGGSTSFIDNGGCIAVNGALTLNDVTVQACNAAFEGGGIYVGSGSLSVTNGLFTLNRAGDDGGAIRVFNGTLSITGTVITNNTAIGFFSSSTRGGGIDYEGTSLTITGATLSGNRATDLDGGDALGGGLAVRLIPGSASGSISNSILQSNVLSTTSGVTQGGAIYKFGDGTLSVSNTCIVNNPSPAVYNLQPTIPISAQDNWWGNVWGPRILSASASSGSLVSTGDSIASDGFTSIVVDGTPSLSYGDDDGSPAPAGDWLLSAPSGCLACTPTSSITPGARVCA